MSELHRRPAARGPRGAPRGRLYKSGYGPRASLVTVPPLTGLYPRLESPKALSATRQERLLAEHSLRTSQGWRGSDGLPEPP